MDVDSVPQILPQCMELIKTIAEYGTPKELEAHFKNLPEQDSRMMVEYFERVTRKRLILSTTLNIVFRLCVVQISMEIKGKSSSYFVD